MLVAAQLEKWVFQKLRTVLLGIKVEFEGFHTNLSY